VEPCGTALFVTDSGSVSSCSRGNCGTHRTKPRDLSRPLRPGLNLFRNFDFRCPTESGVQAELLPLLSPIRVANNRHVYTSYSTSHRRVLRYRPSSRHSSQRSRMDRHPLRAKKGDPGGDGRADGRGRTSTDEHCRRGSWETRGREDPV